MGADKWASLSNTIIFQANQSPTDLDMIPNVAHFVEQELLQGKPRMQKLGINLQEIEMTVKFHFSVTPFKTLKNSLNQAAYNGTVLQWIWGTGEPVGDFVITKWKEKVKKTDEAGLIYATEINLTLKEYSGPGVADQTGLNAALAAFANKVPVSPVISLTPVGATSVSSISNGITNLDMTSYKIAKKLTLLQQANMSMERFKRDVLPYVNTIKRSVNDINAAIAIARNLKNAANLTTALSTMGVAANSLGIGLGNDPTLAQVSTLCNNLSLASGGVDQAAASSQIVKSWFPPLHI